MTKFMRQFINGKMEAANCYYGGVEDRVEVALVDRGLLLLHALVAEHEPHLDVRI